jgi:hypothetical protein
MVNFSSLHDEGRLNDALHQFHSIELVIALQMVVSWWILDFIIEVFHGDVGKYYVTATLHSSTQTIELQHDAVDLDVWH